MTTRHESRRDLIALALLVAVGVGAPLALAAMSGAVGLPSNDDWVYMRGAASLYRTGAIAMPGHTAASVGQLVMVQPFLWLSGGGQWAFTAFELAVTGVGIAATFLLGRQYLSRGAAVAVTLLVLAFPGFERQSTGFMTDIPAFTTTMLSLLLGVRWLRGGRRATLIAALLVGLIGASIREFALAAPAAVLVSAWAGSRPRDRGFVVLATGLFALGVVALLVLVRSAALHGGLGLAPEPIRIYLLLPALTTLSAILLPALVTGIVLRRSTLRPVHLLWGAVVVAPVLAVPTIGPLVGQFWLPDGMVANALLNGARQPAIGDALWLGSQVLALVAGVFFAALVARWLLGRLAGVSTVRMASARLLDVIRAPTAPLLLFLLAYTAELAVVVIAGTYPLDRYLYPMVAPAAILVLHEARAARDVDRARGLVPLGYAALAWLALSAVVITTNAYAFDTARWRAGDAVVGMGYAADTVDAGYDWVGYHIAVRADGVPAPEGPTWYDTMLMSASPCAVVSNTPMDDRRYALIRSDVTAYRQYLLLGPDLPLYLYGSVEARCSRPSP